MITITKERLLTIKQWRETYGPGSNVVLPAEEAEELARIALTSLEAEPVAYIFKHPAGKLFWALTDESNKEQADVIPVYAAAPASVVPDNASEPLAYAYKELTPEIMRNHLAVFERYGIAPNDSSTTIQALRIALDGIERSDAMLHGAEPVSQTYKLNELAGNSPVIPGEVLSAILKVARVRADFDDFDGDRRGIGDCLDEAEQELIVTINKYASQLAAGPIAPNDVREQTAVPPVPVIQADVAQAIEKLKRKLVECNRYNYCADAVKGVEYACHAAMLQGSQPVSQTYKFPVNTPCQDAPAHIWLQTAGVWPEDGELSELTWCSHNQHHDDTLYVRADLVNGNYPVTPDGWISCRERMPPQDDWILIYSNHGEYMAGQVQGEYVELSDGTLSWLGNVLFWMPLPEPPKGAK
ncbi:DUF551 domain-containing protein [Escherichia coli]|nr:DUF551 domain-containing protein [Escherichia coli]EJH6962082.1 DUF551 domain-containing protein [Escherichia coli O145:H28]EEW8780829.1 DUF551 domain-containing protein [Escherichia coli]EEY1537710.1 DUF551 domain-containing protein [Escherichia coli]EFE0064359.1 DUF551 domain-containing protein [Escherichia coli]